MFLKQKRIHFIIVGVQKAGTSAIHNYLSQHQSIFMPDKKELHYFDRLQSTRLFNTYKAYHKYFDFSSNKLLGEATPIYCYWKNSLERIKKYNPNIKLILILRNPIDRAYSHWNMEYARGFEKRSFLQAIKEEIQEIETNTYVPHKVKSYVDRGLYSSQVKKMYSLFEKKNTYVDFYFNLKKDEKLFMDSILHFLEVDTGNYVFKKKKVNKFSYERSISNDEKKILTTFYRNDIRQLEKLVNINLDCWLHD